MGFLFFIIEENEMYNNGQPNNMTNIVQSLRPVPGEACHMELKIGTINLSHLISIIFDANNLFIMKLRPVQCIIFSTHY